LGIDTHRITFERQSRNTFEDVFYAKAIIHPAPGETWILVTGASHMPRSVGLFRGQGWQVVPYPANSITGAGPDDPRSRRFLPEPRAVDNCPQGVVRHAGQQMARSQ
jgi:uncharacterized SAM-binding protein YcdF (DUF218 family)